jgi:hypothetical protein
MEINRQTLLSAELLHVEDRLWVLTAPEQNPNYDFRFDNFFPCRRVPQPAEPVVAVARIGAFANYPHLFAALQDDGITLIHTPDQHLLATELPRWYPRIADLTPKSLWFSGPLDVDAVSSELGWPIFMKGTRQTSRHRQALSIIEGPDQLRQVLVQYAEDPLLRWQGIVCRELVRLRLVDDSDPLRLPCAFEFRTFWWKGELVGWGRYWWEGKDYKGTEAEMAAGLAVAREAARRVSVPFLVVDIAQTEDRRWLVIECNDGQESGYGGCSPIGLWQRILDVEKGAGGMALSLVTNPSA